MRPREQARADTIERIKGLAREQLHSVGPSELSLRGIARDLGLVSSAVYRYVESRDQLLTLLIADGYDRLGSAVEAAEAAVDRTDFRGRLLTAGRAIRAWAIDHPFEYALLFGSPVPGYAAPAEVTVPPAQRTPLVLVGLLVDAHAAGAVDVDRARPLDRSLRDDVGTVGLDLVLDVPAPVLATGVLVWIHLFGAVSFELFGHLHNVIDDKAGWFDHQLEVLADLLGLPPARRARGSRAARPAR